MRHVVSLMHISLDGFAAGPNGEMNWITTDEEIFDDVAVMLTTVDTALYGRVTYQMMESYWPTAPSNPDATKHDIEHSRWVEAVQKVVFSTTMDQAVWNNSYLAQDPIAVEIARLKQHAGQNMMIFGSPGLTRAFMREGLIDEYRINVNPVILGAGIPYFEAFQAQTNLRLLTSKTFQSGVIGLHYQKV